MRKRTVSINIRVTEQEKKRIVRNAKMSRLPVSEYLRQLAQGHRPDTTIPSVWKEAGDGHNQNLANPGQPEAGG